MILIFINHTAIIFSVLLIGVECVCVVAMLLQSAPTSGSVQPSPVQQTSPRHNSVSAGGGIQDANAAAAQKIQLPEPAPGWTAHITKEGRIFYCK